MQYPGIDGFLPFRGSLMLDVVVVAMAAVLPLLGYSIFVVRYRRNFVLHKRLQLILAAALLVTVTAFELDMRFNGWRERAKPSPYYATWVDPSLYLHLVFSVSTAALWIWVTVAAVRKFPDPPCPGQHSPQHLLWARLAALDMLLTSISGWAFYYLSFVA